MMQRDTREGLLVGAALGIAAIAVAVGAASAARGDVIKGKTYAIQGPVCLSLEAMQQVLEVGKVRGEPGMVSTHILLQRGRECAVTQGIVTPIRHHDSADIPGKGTLWIIEAETKTGASLFMLMPEPVSEPGQPI